MFDAIYLKTWLSAKNEIRVEMTIASECTGERNQLFPFLMKKVRANQDRGVFLAFVFISYHKK